MIGKRGRPSWLTPLVKARSTSPSLQEPSAAGVMLGACSSPGKPAAWPKTSPPLPSVPATTGFEKRVSSCWLWQSRQMVT
jgi:hypothetical protein